MVKENERDPMIKLHYNTMFVREMNVSKSAFDLQIVNENHKTKSKLCHFSDFIMWNVDTNYFFSKFHFFFMIKTDK